MHTTGLAELDKILHGIMPGDNIVWSVENVEAYRHIVIPFAESALRQGKKIIYFRFAEHIPLLAPRDGIFIHEIDPSKGFEKFGLEIVDIIEKRAEDSWYIFDSLSGLANAWYSDRMLSNFLLIICPFILKLESLAYFALYKACHSGHAANTIYTTAQIFIDVYTSEDKFYIQPQKVENRYSSTMYLLHVQDGETFTPVTNSAITAKVVGGIKSQLFNFTIQQFGVWTQTYHDAQIAIQSVQQGNVPESTLESYKEILLQMVVTRQKSFLSLARKYLDLTDLTTILKRMIGSGLIGGKARGILLAQKILKTADPKWNDFLEVHDSFFIGSDVFYTYIIRNDCWWLRRKTGTIEDILLRAKIARERILQGEFLDYIIAQFQEMLDYFGQSPIIVRSSSLQEDSYGNAFSGKYESIFCANQGTPEQRLEEFLSAVRRIYASSMDTEALMYRQHHGLFFEDEQMALLVQRVSGDVYGSSFFPLAAGVGFSYNPYRWDAEIDPTAGMLRLAFGLGTRAVDRIDDDYTRIVALNAPDKCPEKHEEDSHKYIQRDADVVELGRNCFATYSVRKLLSLLPADILPYFAEEDEEMISRGRELGIQPSSPWKLSFNALFSRTDFIPKMREMLALLQNEYNYQVDTEFTVNITRNGEYKVNLVQCRPFKVRIMGSGELAVKPEHIDKKNIIMKTNGPIIGKSAATKIDRLIYVRPSAYTKLGEQERYSVARLMGELTQAPHFKTIMLVGPGRWGTSTTAMGVPVTFREIKNASILVELAVMHEGLVPDVSLGTHFFNDIVEMDMLYFAVFPERQGNAFNEDFFLEKNNNLKTLLPSKGNWEDTIIVLENSTESSGKAMYLHSDSINQQAICYIK